jgi:hypothetical protein
MHQRVRLHLNGPAPRRAARGWARFELDLAEVFTSNGHPVRAVKAPQLSYPTSLHRQADLGRLFDACVAAWGSLTLVVVVTLNLGVATHQQILRLQPDQLRFMFWGGKTQLGELWCRNPALQAAFAQLSQQASTYRTVTTQWTMTVSACGERL